MHARRGFTLIELIAGLALAGVVFMSMLMFVDQLRDGRDRLLENARRENKFSNGQRMLRSLLANAIASGDTLDRFIGDAGGASFLTWCAVPGGWMERCRAILKIETDDDSTFVITELSTGARTPLVGTTSPIRFEYFDATQTEAEWQTSWGNSSAVPSAVAVITPLDTIVVRVGGRG
jgi:prepilin-type N-terminal cleavage/methylation domain-containing protein